MGFLVFLLGIFQLLIYKIPDRDVVPSGRKVFSKGRMWHGDVLLCEAEGLFVRPKDTSMFSSLARRDA